MTFPAPIPPRILLILTAATAVAACGPSTQPAATAPPEAPRPAADAGYLDPPEPVAAVRRPQGLALSGTAPSGSEVRLASPDGGGGAAVADAKGDWTLILPAPMGQPAMYALSARLGDRTIRAEGAVMVLPPPGPPLLMARAGFAALPLEGPAQRLQITALDYDSGGGAAVAGVGPARARVRLTIDGVEAGLDQADAKGRFAVIGANRPLEPGLRTLRVEAGGGGAAEIKVQVRAVQPLGDAAFRAERQDGGWRLDWARAGGGVQSTFVFDDTSAP